MTNIKILVNSKKFEKVEDILQNFELVAEILKEDVIKTLAKANVTTTAIDDYYAVATKKIKENLKNKRHLRGIRKLISCKDAEQRLKILLSKLRGYTHNQMLQTRKNSVAFWQKRYKNEVEVIDTTSDPLELLLQEELQKVKQVKDKELQKFKKMVKNGEIKAIKSENGYAQLCFCFRN